MRTSGEKSIGCFFCGARKEKEKRVPELAGRELTAGFFLTPVVEKTKTKAKNSRKNSTSGRIFLPIRQILEKT